MKEMSRRICEPRAFGRWVNFIASQLGPDIHNFPSGDLLYSHFGACWFSIYLKLRSGNKHLLYGLLLSLSVNVGVPRDLGVGILLSGLCFTWYNKSR